MNNMLNNTIILLNILNLNPETERTYLNKYAWSSIRVHNNTKESTIFLISKIYKSESYVVQVHARGINFLI